MTELERQRALDAATTPFLWKLTGYVIMMLVIGALIAPIMHWLKYDDWTPFVALALTFVIAIWTRHEEDKHYYE